MKILHKIKKSIFYISLFLMSFMFSITKNSADLDLWHRMAVGKIFSQLGNVVYHDIFTYFPSKPLWVDHEWLSGVVFYNLTHYFGDSGILFLKIFILFTILILIYETNQLIYPEPNKQRVGWYFVSTVAIVIGLSATLRCQVFTYLFFTLWIYVLERIRKGEHKLIWIFPAITLIWANMHAGFVAGFGLICFYAAGEFLNSLTQNKASLSASARNSLKYIGILALCLPVTLINPYGLKYWHYLIEAITMPRPYITEWFWLNPFESLFKIIGTKMQVLLLIPALIYKIFSKEENKLQKIDWVEIIAFTATLYISLKHCRHIVFFSIVVAVYGYKYFAVFMDAIFNKVKNKFSGLIDENQQNLIYFTKFMVIYSLIINVCLLLIIDIPHEVNLEGYPTKAIEFIKINKLKGNLLVPFNWGSYALWKLYPQNLISVDGRYEETYTNEAYLDLSQITFHYKDWKKDFYKYHHDVILINKDSATEKEFSKLASWKPVYKDNQTVVFIPSSTTNKKWLQPNKDGKYYIKTKYENNINF